MVDKDHILTVLRIHFEIDNSPIVANDPRITAINDDGGIEINGNVRMIRPAGGRIPVKFYMVDGWFQAERMGLGSLENCPDSCGSLFVASNSLRSLEHAPAYLGSLDISDNRFHNFVGLPQTVSVVTAVDNPLTSLDGLPESPPEEPLTVAISYSSHLPLLRLLVAEEIEIYNPRNNNKRFEPVQSILNSYAGQGSAGAFACGAELATAGFKENARW